MLIYSSILTVFLTDHSEIGYAVVALLAFALGILTTVFCFRIRKHREDKKND